MTIRVDLMNELAKMLTETQTEGFIEDLLMEVRVPLVPRWIVRRVMGYMVPHVLLTVAHRLQEVANASV